jgi:hypothetical protein
MLCSTRFRLQVRHRHTMQGSIMRDAEENLLQKLQRSPLFGGSQGWPVAMAGLGQSVGKCTGFAGAGGSGTASRPKKALRSPFPIA